MTRQPRSALEYVLLALIPYTKANFKLAYKPNQFFNDLELASRYKRKTLQNALSHAKNKGLISVTFDGIELTAAGRKKVKRFTGVKLKHNVYLMVIFDIPELMAGRRQKLRLLLRELQFHQTQKSVWISNFDYRDVLIDAVDEARHQAIRRNI